MNQHIERAEAPNCFLDATSRFGGVAAVGQDQFTAAAGGFNRLASSEGFIVL
jgi:hypothetical protein